MRMRKNHVLMLGATAITFILIYIYVIHPYEIQAFWAYATQRPPVEWNGIVIDYKYGMHAIEHDSSISIHYLGKEREESLGVTVEGKQTLEQFRNRNYNGSGFTFISDRIDRSYGHEIYVVTVTKDDNNRYMVFYHVLDLEIAIGYAGTQERFPAYKEIIDSILFLNKK